MTHNVAPQLEVANDILPAQPYINGGVAVRGIHVSDPESFGTLLEVFGVLPEEVPGWKIAIKPTDATLNPQEQQLTLDLAKIASDVNTQARFDNTTPAHTFSGAIGTTVIEHTAQLFGVDPRLSSGGLTAGDKFFIGVSGLTCGALVGLSSLADAPLPLTAIGVVYGTAIGTAISAGFAMCLREREINRPIDPRFRQISAQLSKAILPTFFEQS
jgi:hypothetical protein